MMKERSAGAVGLVLLAMSLPGCGGGGESAGHSSSKPSSSGASAGAGAQAQALAQARAVNLRDADVPGLPARSAEAQANDPAGEAKIADCVGVSLRGRKLVRVSSPRFGDPNVATALSQFAVDLNQTLSQAALSARNTGDLRAAGSARGIRCSVRFLEEGIAEKNGPGARVVSLHSPLGDEPGVALRVLIRLGKGVRVYQDLLVDHFAYKQIELVCSGVGKPFPIATERRLWKALLARTKAA